MINTKIQIQQGDISVTFEGTESFVKEQLKNLSKTLEILQGRELVVKSTKPESSKVVVPVKSLKSSFIVGEITEKYPTIFSESGDEIKVIYKKLGDNERSKTQNLVLLYAFANENKFPEQKVPYTKLNDQKKDHGIVDKGGNFSSYVKSLRGDIIFTGKGNSATVKLTLPGKEKAQKICDEALKEYESRS